ncbi:Protein RseC [BD1-7 clade bacterium]|uniref:Protein RseC n=1 Tax=BD1-7 clade bacterium TaxID=2029982 RepID=A0A5S9P9R9_9GAMM|nr:Protein RseC [BD1-7 clade bacterium]CAA0115985.1 Protein RseC [BD1-7 clade bacterium]
MICESGKVVAVDGHWAWVETLQMSACNSCSAKAGCGQKALGSIFAGKRHLTRVSLASDLEAVSLGDEVELGIDENVMLKGSIWVYMMPLAVTILVALVFVELSFFASEDINGIVGAFVGFVMSMLGLRLHAFQHRNNPQYRPVLQRIITPAANTKSSEQFVLAQEI